MTVDISEREDHLQKMLQDFKKRAENYANFHRQGQRITKMQALKRLANYMIGKETQNKLTMYSDG